MKYLRNLNNHNDYTTFIVGVNFAEIQAEKKAVVSYCKADAHVHYNPYVEPPFFCKLTLNDGSTVELEGNGELTSTMTNDYKPTLVSAEIGTLCISIGTGAFGGCSGLTSIIIPDSVTSIGEGAFGGCSGLTSVTIGNSVTSIGTYAFQSCSGLTSITIPSNVTSIGYRAFYNCGSLTSIISNAMTAPTIKDNTFQGIKTSGTLTVPSGSSGYDTWMQNANYYLGLYNWTKVEQ